jgi:hypothetical protein
VIRSLVPQFDTEEKVLRHTSRIQKPFRTIRRSLTAIERALKQLSRLLPKTLEEVPQRSRRQLKLAPERLAALRVHGRYLGYLRPLRPTQKAKVKAARAQRGYNAAIALARRLAKT